MVISRCYFYLYCAVTRSLNLFSEYLYINILHKIRYRQEEFSKAADWPKLPPNHKPLKELLKTQPKGLVLFCSKCRQEQGPAEVCRRCLLEKLLEWISEVTAWFWRQGVLPCQGQHFLSPRVTWRQPQAFPPCGWSICLWNWVPVSTVMHLCGYQCPPGGACKKTERLRGILCSTLEKETQVAGASGCVWFRDRTFCSSKWFATYFL